MVKETDTSLLIPQEELVPYEEVIATVERFQNQLQSLDYRVTNKNFGSKLYQTKETINSKARFIAGQKDDVVIMDAQNPTWRLWVGASDPASAPFRVDKNGNLTATSITLTGYIAIGDALADIGSGNITSTYLGPNSVVTSKIAAEAVIASKIDVLDLFAQTIVATGSITGAVVQTTSSSSGRRVVLDSVTNTLKFIYGGGDAGRVTPTFSASGRGIGIETDTGESTIYLNEGSLSSISMTVNDGIDIGSIYVYGGGVDLGGDIYMGGPVEFNDNALNGCGNIRADNDTSDIGTSSTPFDNLRIISVQMKGGLFDLSAITGTAADAETSTDGSMYYRTDDDVIRVKLNGTWKTITTS